MYLTLIRCPNCGGQHPESGLAYNGVPVILCNKMPEGEVRGFSITLPTEGIVGGIGVANEKEGEG